MSFAVWFVVKLFLISVNGKILTFLVEVELVEDTHGFPRHLNKNTVLDLPTKKIILNRFL